MLQLNRLRVLIGDTKETLRTMEKRILFFLSDLFFLRMFQTAFAIYVVIERVSLDRTHY